MTRALERLLRGYKTCTICRYRTRSKYSFSQHQRRHRAPIYASFNCAATVPDYFCGKCRYRSHLKINFFGHRCGVSVYKQNVSDDLRPFCCFTCNFQTHSRLMLIKHDSECGRKNEKLRNLPLGVYASYRKFVSCHQFLMQTRCTNIKWLKCQNCMYMRRIKRDHVLHVGCHIANEMRWLYCEVCLFNAEQVFLLKQHILEDHGIE